MRSLKKELSLEPKKIKKRIQDKRKVIHSKVLQKPTADLVSVKDEAELERDEELEFFKREIERRFNKANTKFYRFPRIEYEEESKETSKLHSKKSSKFCEKVRFSKGSAFKLQLDDDLKTEPSKPTDGLFTHTHRRVK